MMKPSVYRIPNKSVIYIDNNIGISHIKLRMNMDYSSVKRVTIINQDLTPDVLGIFTVFTKIQYLNLSSNNILCDVHIDNLAMLSELVMLDLSHNEITNVENNQHIEPTKTFDVLQHIDLSYNRIGYLSLLIFQTMKNLEVLKLHNNKLFRLTHLSTIHVIIPSLNILTLHNNGFICEDLNQNLPDTLLPLIEWINEENIERSIHKNGMYVHNSMAGTACYVTKFHQIKDYPIGCCDDVKLQLFEKYDDTLDIEYYQFFLSILNSLDICIEACSIDNGLHGNLLLHI